jgi:hypothetical protein
MVKSWFKFVTSAKRLDGLVGDWGSADMSWSLNDSSQLMS